MCSCSRVRVGGMLKSLGRDEIDGIVAWQCSLNEPSPFTENIEIRSSHTGLGVNPLALYAAAARHEGLYVD